MIVPLHAVVGIGLPGDREAIQTQIDMRGAELMHGAPVTVHVTSPTRRLLSRIVRVVVDETADVFRQRRAGQTQERDGDESAGSTQSNGSHEHVLSKRMIIRR